MIVMQTRRLTVFILAVLVTLGLAQAQQQQETQPQQQQQQQQQQQWQQPWQQQGDMTIDQALSELRAMHARLGQIISALEGQDARTQFGDRIGRIEQQAWTRGLRDAQFGLRGLQQAVEAGDQPEETAREIGTIRRDFRGAFAGATGEARDRFTALEQELATLEQQVREGAEGVGETFQGLLDRFGEELDRDRQQFDQQDRQRTLTDLRTRFGGLRADIEAGQEGERVAGEIGQIRQQFGRAFMGAADDERERADAFGEELGRLEEQVRAGDEQARQTYEDLTRRFEEDFRQPGLDWDDDDDGAGAGGGAGAGQ
jgi:uncharacterized protein YdeI (BOF family)